MKRTLFVAAVAALGVVLLHSQSPITPAAKKATAPVRSEKLLPRFPDFGQLPPPGVYTGRIFKLSQDFPRVLPQMDPAVKKILAIDFTKDWKKYMLAVRDYIYEGNIEAEGVANDFYL